MRMLEAQRQTNLVSESPSMVKRSNVVCRCGYEQTGRPSPKPRPNLALNDLHRKKIWHSRKRDVSQLWFRWFLEANRRQLWELVHVGGYRGIMISGQVRGFHHSTSCTTSWRDKRAKRMRYQSVRFLVKSHQSATYQQRKQCIASAES